MDLLGLTPIHYAARNGHWNCVSFLISYGANIWMLDNDTHTALDLAALENREDIVKLLDQAQTEQTLKNPKVVQKLKEKAMRDAEANRKTYERLQDKASKDLEKSRRQMEKESSLQNGEFKAPTKKSFVKTLTWKIKGGTSKSKAAKGTAVFSDLVNGTTRGMSTPRTGDEFSATDFKVSEVDDSGKRTLRSVKGTAMRKDAQVLYISNIDIDGPSEKGPEGSARPALTNVFPGASVADRGGSTDSGVGNSFEDEDGLEVFNRPMFGDQKLQLSFMNRFKPTDSFQTLEAPSIDDVEKDLQNGDILTNGFNGEDEDSKRLSDGKGSIDLPVGLIGDEEALPWKAEDVDDDDEEESQFTPVLTFLESCGLRLYTGLFLEAEVDMDALMRLTSQDFSDMGLPTGPRRKVMDAIQRRRIVLNEPAQMYDSQL